MRPANAPRATGASAAHPVDAAALKAARPIIVARDAERNMSPIITTSEQAVVLLYLADVRNHIITQGRRDSCSSAHAEQQAWLISGT